MNTDPEPTTETEDLRARLARVEAHAEAMEAHVLDDIRFQERRRALSRLLLALGGLLISLFLPWTEETEEEVGVDHLSALLSGMEHDHPFLGVAAAGVVIMLIVGCAALPFLSRPLPPVLLNGLAILVAPVLGLAVPLMLSEEILGIGILVACVSVIAVPVSAARVAKFPKADSEPHPARKKSP